MLIQMTFEKYFFVNQFLIDFSFIKERTVI